MGTLLSQGRPLVLLLFAGSGMDSPNLALLPQCSPCLLACPGGCAETAGKKRTVQPFQHPSNICKSPNTPKRQQWDPKPCSTALFAHILAMGTLAPSGAQQQRHRWLHVVLAWPRPRAAMDVHWQPNPTPGCFQHNGSGDLSIAETQDVFSIYFCTLCNGDV